MAHSKELCPAVEERRESAMDLPERFRALRKQRNLTAVALGADRYSPSYISQIERGARRPSRRALEYFAWRLGVSPSYLLTGVPDDLPLRLRFELEQAEHAVSHGEFSEARQRSEDVLTEAEKYRVPDLTLWGSLILADALYGEDRFSEARELYERLLERDDLFPRDRVRGTAGLARASRALGDLNYAAVTVEALLAKRDMDPPLDHAAVAELQTVLSSLYYEQGDTQLAQRAAERALAALDESVPLATQAIVRHNASCAFAAQGQWREALILAHEARTLGHAITNQRDRGKLYTAHAFLCLEADPPLVDEAAQQLDRAERIVSKVGEDADLAYIWTERARVAFFRGEFEEAVAFADRAASTEGVFVLERGRALLLAGRALRALGRLLGARERVQEALAVFEANEAKAQAVLCWEELGEMAKEEGDFEAATEAFQAGVRVAGGGRASLIF
jgi:tetratricopeptide (TPR) repeat protein